VRSEIKNNTFFHGTKHTQTFILDDLAYCMAVTFAVKNIIILSEGTASSNR